MTELEDALDRLQTWGHEPLTVQVVTDLAVAVDAAKQVANAKSFTIHWCEINGMPGNDCPDHERHHNREQEHPAGRCGDKTLLALDIPTERKAADAD